MKTNRLQLAGIIKGDTGKSSYEYAVEQGYQGTEEEFAEIIKNTLDAKDVIQSSKEEVLSAKESVDASKTDVLKAKQSVDSSKTEVLNAKNEVNNLNTQFEAKVTEAIGDITDAKTQSVSDIQAAGTAQTNKVTTAGTTAVSNIDTKKEEALSSVTSAGTTAVSSVNKTKDQAITQLQDKGSEILESINSESVADVTGSDIAAVKTHEGSAIIKELSGGTKQEKTSGYNLFDASKLSTTSQGGATVTNNGDGSFTISGSGDLSKQYGISTDISSEILKVGKIYLKTSTSTNPYFFVTFIDGNQSAVCELRNNSELEITDEMLSKIKVIRFGFFANNGSEIRSGTIKPMIYQDGDGTWEPYTGAAPSPNPEYPQTIESIGGNGWFDGECDIGFWSESQGIGKRLNIVNDPAYRRFKNPIPCAENDVIEFNISKPNQYIYLFALDENECLIKTFYEIGTGAIGKKQVVATMPTGTKYCIGYYGGTNPILKESDIAILKNNKYAVKVKTCGKNLISGMEVGAYDHGNGNKLVAGNYRRSVNIIPVKEGKTYIVSQKETSFQVSFVKYDENRRFMDFKATESMTIPKGCKYIAINIMVGSSEVHDVQLEESETPTSYEPYKESISYIPLDSPLYEGDRIYLEDGELWEYRVNERVVFDGSEDEGWNDNGQSTDTRQYFVSFIDGLLNKDSFEYADKLFCNKFRIVEKNGFNGAYTIRKGTATGTAGDRLAVVFEVPIDLVSNVAEWEEWVKNNPFDLIYKLATPTRKKLGSAEAFNLRTFNERTYIEVVGAKDLNTQNTFVVPKNQLGGLATEAFATSKLNAHKFENVSSYISAEDLHAYGFVEHMDILSPANRIEYVGRNKDFRAMSMDFTKNKTDYGSWSDFPSLVQNKPYMVKPTGEVDYQLDENNYSLKATGGQSDVANTSYDGGAFSKFIKVYVKRWIEGNDRHVRFSYVPLEGYTPCGFIDSDGTEMDYVWLPMFYGATVGGKMRSLSGLQPDINQSTETQNTNITAFSDRAAFYGGPIVETLRDMLYMLFKTTDIQEACGYGNRSGYDSASSPYYGVLPNAVVGGGQFYGTKDGKSLNKIFHSIVLGTYQQYQRDPYYLVVNGRYKVSIDYTYDLTGSKYIDTGIDSETVSTNQWLYPSKCKVVEGFGSIPVGPMKASSVTGYCAGVYHPANKNITAVVLRFGNCYVGSVGGWPCLALGNSSAAAAWNVAVSVLLKAPATA